MAEASEGGRAVAHAEDLTAVATGWLSLSIPYAKLWSPESPHLYDLDIRLYDGEVEEKLLPCWQQGVFL